MTEPQWKRSTVIDSGNYPKTSFVGVLKSIGIVYSDGLGAKTLQLEFEAGQVYSMPLNAKDYGLHEDGQIDGFLAIGKFINSLEKIDIATGEINMNNNDPNIKRIETFWAWLDGEPTGFKTEPDITGCTLHNVATPKEIGDADQSAKAAKWPEWTIKKIEGLTQAKKPSAKAPSPAKTKASVPTAEPAQDSGLSTLILSVLSADKPISISEIYSGLGKKYKVGPLGAEIKQLKADELIIQTGDKYSKVV